MAQQLALLRTPEAYAGVAAYARSHTGEAAATAYLALGHAYLLDKRYAEAAENLALAKRNGAELADYDGFSVREGQTMKRGMKQRPRRCCMDSPNVIRRAFLICRRRNWKRTFCWR